MERTTSLKAQIHSYPEMSRKLRYRELHIQVLHLQGHLIRAVEDQATIHRHAGRPAGHIRVRAEGFNI